jgi:hypothetical protein
MHSPQQAFSAFRPGKASQAHSHSKELATRWLVLSPRTFSQVCSGFADILALPVDKTIHESWEASLLVQ